MIRKPAFTSQLFSVAFDAHPSAVFVFERDSFKILAVNRKAEKKFSYTRDELRSMDYWGLTGRGGRSFAVDTTKVARIPRKAVFIAKSGSGLSLILKSSSILFDGRPAELVLAHDGPEPGPSSVGGRPSPARINNIADNGPDILRLAGCILDIIPDPMIILDAKFIISAANPAFCALFKKMPERTIGRSFFDISKGVWNIPSIRGPMNALASGRKSGLDVDNITAAFNRIGIKSLSMKARRCTSNEMAGNPHMILLTFHDLTELRNVSSALKKSEDNFRIMAETASSVVSVYENDRFVYVNQAFVDSTGYTSNELMASEFLNIIHPDYRDLIRERSAVRIQGGRSPERYQFKIVRKDGQERWLDFLASKLEWNGRPAVLCVAHDITELKEFQEKARHDAEIIRTLTEASPEKFFIKDDELRYLMINDRYARMLGAEEEDILGRKDDEFLPREKSDPILRTDLELLSSDLPAVISEFDFDGRNMETLKFKFRLPSGKNGIGGYLRDITEVKQAEREHRERERRYLTLLDNLPGMVYGCLNGPDWSFTLISDGCLSITGYKPDEFRGEERITFLDLIAPEFRGLITEKTILAISLKQPFEYEYQLVRSDGRRIWVWDRGRGVYDDSGRLLFLEGYVEDITARKEAEDKLIGLNRDLERQLAEMRIVHQMSEKLLALVSLEDIGREIFRLLKDIPRYDHMDLFTIDQPTGRLILVFTDQWFQEDGLCNEEVRAADLAALSNTRLRIGVGITGSCAALGESVIVDDVLRDGRYLSFRLEDTRSEICVPSKLPDGRIVGLLNVESRSLTAFGERDRRLLETISALVGSAMEKARLYENASRRTAFLSAINKAVTDAEKAQRDMPAFLELVLEDILRAFGLFRGLIRLDPQPGTAGDPKETAAFRGMNKTEYEGKIRRLAGQDKSIEGTMYVTGFTHPATLSPDKQDAPSAMGIALAVKVPLQTIGGKMVGVLALFSDAPRIWTSEETALLETMGAQLAMAIEMSLLDINARHRLLELETINTVSAALRTAATKEEMLPLLLDKTLEAMETDSGHIWLYDRETDSLRTAVASGWFKGFEDISLELPDQRSPDLISVMKETHVTDDISTDPILPAEFRKLVPSGWSCATVPILSESDAWGGMSVSLPHSRQFMPLDVKLLTSLADMAGTALHRMSLFDETARRLGSLQSLRAIDQAIISSVDIKLTLDFILEQITSQLCVDAAGIRLIDKQLLSMRSAACRGFLGDAFRKIHVLRGDGSGAGRIFKDGEFMCVDDPGKLSEAVDPELVSEEQLVAYAVAPLVSKGEFLGTLEAFFRKRPTFDKEWMFMFETMAGQAAIAIDNSLMFSDLKRSNRELALSYDATIEGWAYALDLRDRETEYHTRRVTEIALRLAKEVGLSPEHLPHFRRGALLHDMGKMGVPDSILLKPGPLTAEEWAIMKQHPRIAMEMLARIEYLRPALDIPYCHHEKWDGSGYPRELKHEEIPLAARIFAVADVYDALNSDRPYRKAWPKGKAADYIKEQAGKHFDPRIVEIFTALVAAGEI